jgi:hypothetical protein
MLFYLGFPAVTIEGTVIHKSGSITGGQSSQGAGRKWDEKEVQGQSGLLHLRRSSEPSVDVLPVVLGLHKQRDSLMAYLKELLAQKPKGKTDENYIGGISRLDAELVLVRDDLVRILFEPSSTGSCVRSLILVCTLLLRVERYEASTDRTQGRALPRRERGPNRLGQSRTGTPSLHSSLNLQITLLISSSLMVR